MSVCLCVCMYPSSAHSFGTIGMKLGMDTPWEPGSDMGKVRLRFSARALHYAQSLKWMKGITFFSESQNYFVTMFSSISLKKKKKLFLRNQEVLCFFMRFGPRRSFYEKASDKLC